MGLFFECLPDDPALSPDPAVRAQNVRRLRFYERFGARPIVGTAYETPLKPGDTDPPYLDYGDLGRDRPLSRAAARSIVRHRLPPRQRAAGDLLRARRRAHRLHPRGPAGAYPYLTGFREERGRGEGLGCNSNLPLPEAVDGPAYRAASRQARPAASPS
ncbi:MAG TPA: hypothetical protein VN033_14750 [Vulgatibacter sp.]|nr:hypothetical protein [Vulgatibacter sp.]